jgi:hypothetical protein
VREYPHLSELFGRVALPVELIYFVSKRTLKIVFEESFLLPGYTALLRNYAYPIPTLAVSIVFHRNNVSSREVSVKCVCSVFVFSKRPSWLEQFKRELGMRCLFRFENKTNPP